MKIKMKVHISGTRNGEPWPAAGGEIELPDAEAAKYCANDLATPVRSDGDDVEKRDEPDEPARKKSGPKTAPGEKRKA